MRRRGAAARSAPRARLAHAPSSRRATLLAEVQRAWPSAAGDAFAAQAQPVAERGGVVTVACASAVWAQELDLISERVVERLNAGARTARGDGACAPQARAAPRR